MFVVFQTRPVPFTVHAVVTSSDLEFDTTDVDFGCCTIYESVTKTIKLTNTSILPQKFGFVGIPNVSRSLTHWPLWDYLYQWKFNCIIFKHFSVTGIWGILFEITLK